MADTIAVPVPQTGSRKWWTLGALVVAVMAVGLDATILSVALPTLAGVLHASTSQLQWFAAAYTLVLAAALLPAGLLGDRYGRKRIMLLALAIFGIGSIACAWSSTAGEFIAARVLAGLGAALMVPVSLSVISVVFTDAERPKAVGAWAAANFLALPVGPILGGWLLSHYWWGWVFLINVPVVLLGMAATAWMLPESRASVRPSFDPVGITASVAGLGLLTYGFIEAGQLGWGHVPALGEIAAGVLLLAGFAAWELRLRRRADRTPLVDLDLFRAPSFTWGTVLAAIGIFAMFGVLFAAPQYFQAVLGADAMGSGVRLLPVIAGVAIGAGTADRIAARLGVKFTAAAGLVVLAAGALMGAATRAGTGTGFTATWMVLCGLGMGTSLSTAAAAALGELTGDRAGVGSALMQTVQKAGAPLAVAVLGSVLNTGYQSRLGLAGVPAAAAGAARQSVFDGLAVAAKLGSASLAGSVRAAFLHGMDLMLVVSGALAVAGVVLAVLFLPGRPRVPAAVPATGAAESDHAVPIS